MPSSPGAPLLSIRSLSKTFPGLRALNGIDLDVHAGEIVGLIGQNGSGKSTLVKTLAGIHDPDPGSVIGVMRADGSINEDAGVVRRRLHFIHQDLGLVPTLSTVENIDLNKRYGARALWPSPRQAQREHARSLLDRLGSSIDVEAPVGRLSASERAIVAIARALAPKPALIFADEPTGNLDAATGAAIIDLLFARRAESGATLVMITHDEALAKRCERVVTLADGRVLTDTTT